LHESESELLNDWRFTANQFVLAPSSLRFTTRAFFLQLNPYATSSLTWGWLCILWICLAFVSYIACYWKFLLLCYIRVFCQSRLCKTDHVYLTCLLYNIYKFSSYLTCNTLHLPNKAQPVNAVWRNSRCLLWEPYGTHKYAVWAECRDILYKNSVRTSQETHYVSATVINRLMLSGETVAVYYENHTEHINTLTG
jgi:hypothetical protein